MWGLHLLLNCALLQLILMASISTQIAAWLFQVYSQEGDLLYPNFIQRVSWSRSFSQDAKKLSKLCCRVFANYDPAPAFKAPKKSHTHSLSPRDPSSSLSPPPVLDIFTFGWWLWLWGDVAKGEGCCGPGSSDLGFYLLHSSPDIGQTPQQ